MSTHWWIECRKCREARTESFNRRREDLIKAVPSAPLLERLREIGWSLCEMEFQGMAGVADFLAVHAVCDAFWVVCEYTWARPDLYPEERVPIHG